jgi:hypothetical protein
MKLENALPASLPPLPSQPQYKHNKIAPQARSNPPIRFKLFREADCTEQAYPHEGIPLERVDFAL